MYEYIALHEANVENNIRLNILKNFYYLPIPETYHEDIITKYNKFYNTSYDYEDNKHNKTIFIVHLYRKFYLPLLNYKNKIYLQKFKEDCNKLNNINSTYFEYFNLYKYFYNEPKLWNKIWRMENKEYNVMKKKQWRDANKEHVSEYHKNYREKNKEELKAFKGEKYYANVDAKLQDKI